MSSLSLKIRPLSWVQPLEAELARKRERNQTSSERSNTLDISKSLDLLTVDTTETRQLSEEDTTSSELEGRKEMGNKGKTQTVKKRKSGVGLREVQALLSLSQLTETKLRSVKTQRQDSQPTPENMTATDEHEMTNVEVNNKAKETVLREWALHFVGKTGSICLEGLYEPSGVFWRSTSIVKRLDATHLTTKRGSVYVIKGHIDESGMLEKDFPVNLIQAFQNGFPKNWKQLIEEHAESMRTRYVRLRL
jgi:hypothetical protein